MARLIEIKCPKCSAPVSIEADATSVTCRYCGGTSLIERKQAAAATAGAAPVVVSKSQPALVGALLTLGLAGLGATFALQSAVSDAPVGSGPDLSNAAAPTASALHFSDRPMLADVNGDGVLDVLGKARTRTRDTGNHIVSLDGNTGAELWRSEPLTKDASESDTLRGVLLGRVVSVDALGKVQAYDLRTGNPSWSALLGEKARSVCEADGAIVITTADDQRHALDPTSGKKRELGRDAPCAPVYSSERDTTPGYRIIGWPDMKKLGLPEMNDVEGITAHRALVPTGPGPRFMLGQRAKGTAVAMIAAVDERKKVLWKDIVPGVDPLTTEVNPLSIEAAVIDGKLVVPYALKDHNTGTRVACFDVATGERLWDVQGLPKDDNSYGIAVSPERVFITSWFEPGVVLSLATGERQYLLGGK